MTVTDSSIACDYCALPIAQVSGSPSNSSTGSTAIYCCFGCKIAAAIAGESGEEGQTRSMLTRLGVALFFSMNVMALTMALWSQEWNGELTAAAQVSFDLPRYGCLLLSLPVLFLLGGPLIGNAFEQLRLGRISTDLLIAAGVIAAYGYSLVSVLTGTGHVYFEIGCMVLVTMTLGRYLEATGKLKTTQALRDLEKLLPASVRLATCDGDFWVAAEKVMPDDLMHVLPGERIAADGHIERNSSTIDEHVVTGESQPVVKEPGERVFSGTLNLDGDLYIRAASPCTASALQTMIKAVIAAASGQDRFQRLADRITHWFFPAIVTIAAATLAVHWYRDALAPAIMTALAVVLIACPCALGLATPMALWSALGRASREGILFRNGDVLSKLAQVDTVCFDKTGTLTSGQSQLAAMYVLPTADVDQLLAVARGLASVTNHPLAQSLREQLSNSIDEVEISQAQTVPGRGVSAHVTPLGQACLGSLRFFAEAGIETSSPLLQLGGDPQEDTELSQSYSLEEILAHETSRSLVALACEGRLSALFLFEESLRPGALQTVSALQRAGLEVFMLTGDRQERADAIASELGIEAIAELLPDQKLAHLEAWQTQRRRVLMIGDGLNDGPALAAAHVSVALGCGADLSRELADVCLLSNDLTRLSSILTLSRDTVRTIRWNLLWAFGYNAIGVLLAAGGLLHPIVAAVAMVGSSVLVVSNSLRLARSEEIQQQHTPEVVRPFFTPRTPGSYASDTSPAPPQSWESCR